MLKIVIVEDDRMVAALNSQFAEKTPGVKVVATFYNGRDALAFLDQREVDLVLLDLFMPEMSGLELLEELRHRGKTMDVIMITAMNDVTSLQKALHLGAVDYLVKPFLYERFEQALNKVVVRRKAMEKGMNFTQEDIDSIVSSSRVNPASRSLELDKGMQRQTLERIRDCMSAHTGAYLTAELVASETGLSKITVRRYLNYMIETDEVVSRVDYSTGGRPRTEYRNTKGS